LGLACGSKTFGSSGLGLWKTQVDDVGLEHIKGLIKMWQLILDETKVTDAGLVHLRGMTGLELRCDCLQR